MPSGLLVRLLKEQQQRVDERERSMEEAFASGSLKRHVGENHAAVPARSVAAQEVAEALSY